MFLAFSTLKTFDLLLIFSLQARLAQMMAGHEQDATSTQSGGPTTENHPKPGPASLTDIQLATSMGLEEVKREKNLPS